MPGQTYERLLQDLAEAGASQDAERSAGDAAAGPGLESVGEAAGEEAVGGPALSATPVSRAALDLLVAAEVSSRAFYTAKLTHPVRPGGNSGVTIGIGYDVGTVRVAGLRRDWAGELPPAALSLLERACGVLGPAADALLPGLAGVTVGYDQAERVFLKQSVPRFVGEAEQALPNTALVGPDCLGALVSLTFNRGGDKYRNPDDRYREMRAIRAHMQAQDFDRVPSELRAMKRIWQGNPSLRGVVLRREAEAVLFEQGLAGGQTEAVVADTDPHLDPDEAVRAPPEMTEAPRPWRVAEALLTLRRQVNEAAPGRSKASDGTIGDAAHAVRTSDHNPWIVDGGMGVVTGMDLTHDPAHGCDGHLLAEALRGSRDPRIKYVIWNRRIFSAAVAAWEWRAYTGTNAHTHHVHVSVAEDKARYDSTAPWRAAPVTG